jgi:hypothetical protein
MKKLIAIICGTNLLLLSSASLAAPPFEQMDINKDGIISLKEAAKLKNLPKVYPLWIKMGTASLIARNTATC